tara:strand:- start:1836 stop:2192 length:357 start_codon:yes stop_codon:yes gene_type:complete
MKYLLILFLFISSFAFAQESNNKNSKSTFKVSGVCEMCKSRIEKGSIKIKGVKYAKWDLNSNNLSIIYNSTKIDLNTIQKKIAHLGHDTEKFKSSEKVYNSLPECCYYKSVEIHSMNK